MRSFFKRVLLIIIDAITLYLSYYVSYLILNLMAMQTTDVIINNAYILVGIKIAAYLIFFMYSLNRYRSFFLDVIGVLAANAAAIFAANYLYDVVITDNLIYFGIVIGFDLLISIMIRFLVRTSGEDDYDDEDEDDEDENEENQNTLYQSGIFDPNYKPGEPNLMQQDSAALAAEAQEQTAAEPDPELIEQQKEKDKKIDLLMSELQEKEQRIAILENKIAMQPEYPIYAEPQPTYQPAQQEYAQEYNDNPYGYSTNGQSNLPVSVSKTYADEHKKEILDKILDDIKTLYSTLNSRSRLNEEREYNLLLKMVELEERDRALDEIKRSNEKIFPAGKNRYRKKEPFSSIANLPSDNPDLAKNILKTIEELDAVTGPPISLAQAPAEEYRPIAKQPISNNSVPLERSQQKTSVAPPPSVQTAPQQQMQKPIQQQVPPKQEISLENLLRQQNQQYKQNHGAASQTPPPSNQSQLRPQQGIPQKPQTPTTNAAQQPPKTVPQMQKSTPQQAEQSAQQKTPQRNELDFNTVSFEKVKLEADELNQISSLIDDL